MRRRSPPASCPVGHAFGYSAPVAPDVFRAAVEGWHDFFLAAASASAALLGLLFVGVSINLAAIGSDERADLRSIANQAFSNLLYLLVLSMMVLVADPDARTLAIEFAAVAIVGLVRVIRHTAPLVRTRGRLPGELMAYRRAAWVVSADVGLLTVARGLWATADAGWLDGMIAVVLILLGGAGEASWDLLVRASRETTRGTGTEATAGGGARGES